MSFIYSIRDWVSLYENKESRKLKKLRFVLVPNQHDGLKFRRLMSRPDGAEIFAAWVLILEVASKMENRGILINAEGPLGPTELFLITGMREEVFSNALQVLSSKSFGWIDSEESPATSPEAGRLPGNDPVHLPKKSPRIEGNRTEQNRTEQNTPFGRVAGGVTDDWPNFVTAATGAGMNGSGPDWDEGHPEWKRLDFEQKLAAVRGLALRAGTDDFALRATPRNYLRKRMWERDIKTKPPPKAARPETGHEYIQRILASEDLT